MDCSPKAGYEGSTNCVGGIVLESEVRRRERSEKPPTKVGGIDVSAGNHQLKLAGIDVGAGNHRLRWWDCARIAEAQTQRLLYFLIDHLKLFLIGCVAIARSDH